MKPLKKMAAAELEPFLSSISNLGRSAHRIELDTLPHNASCRKRSCPPVECERGGAPELEFARTGAADRHAVLEALAGQPGQSRRGGRSRHLVGAFDSDATRICPRPGVAGVSDEDISVRGLIAGQPSVEFKAVFA